MEFLTDWTEADFYFAVFVVWAVATIVVLRRAEGLLARVRDDVTRLSDGGPWHADRVCRELRRPKWFDEE